MQSAIDKIEELLKLVLSIRAEFLPVLATMRGQNQINPDSKFSLEEREAVVDACRDKVKFWMPDDIRAEYEQLMHKGFTAYAAKRLHTSFNTFAYEAAGKKELRTALIQFPLPIEAANLVPLMKRVFDLLAPRRTG